MKRKLSSFLKRWHRRIGIVSALFVVLLSLTGLPLLFSGPLGLDQKTMGGAIISGIYHQAPKTPPVGIKLDDGQWVIMLDGLVYIGNADPIALAPPLVTAKKEDRFISVANTNETLLALHDGRLVERMNGVEFTGRTPSPLPKAVKQAVIQRYAGRGMAVSRILLDIHTGRFIGKAGTVLMAVASMLFLLLSLSGIYLWLRKPNGKKPKTG